MPADQAPAPEGLGRLRPARGSVRWRPEATCALGSDEVPPLLAIIWFVLVWASMADNPLLPFVDAAREQVRAASWVLVLFGLEVLRQLHSCSASTRPGTTTSGRTACSVGPIGPVGVG